MHLQLWGYKVEEKLYLGVREQKRLNTAVLEYYYECFLFIQVKEVEHKQITYSFWQRLVEARRRYMQSRKMRISCIENLVEKEQCQLSSCCCCCSGRTGLDYWTLFKDEVYTLFSKRRATPSDAASHHRRPESSSTLSFIFGRCS
jgi:hypothetical protein